MAGMTWQIHKRVWQKRIMICDSYIRPMQKMHTYDSILALSSRVRFVKQNLVSSESLLRIVVNKSHYPKFLVNYPFVPLTAFWDLSESVVWNESGTNRETRTNQERIMNQERIRNTGTNHEHPLRWKMTPHQWKLRVTPLQWKLVVDPTSGNM
jgi:hypothetical protein